MKEYGCCPKFKRRDNSAYILTKRILGGVALTRYTTYLVSLVGVTLTRYMPPFRESIS
jgi:hypothetical protein